jgi:hypothetical protein
MYQQIQPYCHSSAWILALEPGSIAQLMPFSHRPSRRNGRCLKVTSIPGFQEERSGARGGEAESLGLDLGLRSQLGETGESE